MPIREFQNIHEMLKETVDRYPDKPAYKWFLEAGRLDSVTWKEFYAQVQTVSKSLMALGVKKNDKVNILSYTCYRWILADCGITGIGACTVGIYQSNLPKDCEYIINHSDAVVIFAQDDIQLIKLLGIRKNIPNVRKVVLLKGSSNMEDQWAISFEKFLELGKDISNSDLKKRVDEVTPLNPAGTA